MDILMPLSSIALFIYGIVLSEFDKTDASHLSDVISAISLFAGSIIFLMWFMTFGTRIGL